MTGYCFDTEETDMELSLTSVLKRKHLFVFDMDGTLYLGNSVLPGAAEFICRLRGEGRKLLLFTNNASHDPLFYYEKLEKMGFDPQDGEVLTSGDVTAEFLVRHRLGKSVYAVGTPELERQLLRYGVVLREEADIVLTSFDTTLTYRKLEHACRLIRNGAEFLSTHPDLNCPTENGFIPDSGAIAALITASTGKKPIYFGKPCRSALEMMLELTGEKPEDAVIFGDRLYTDIALGKRNGVTAVLTLTGETSKAEAEQASPEQRPDYLVEDMSEASDALFS